MQSPVSRRRWLRQAALAPLAAHAALAAAQAATPADAWPARPIRLVVPFAPGGNTDTLARLLAQGLAASLGQPVVVDNVAGANGSIGAKAVADAAADGHTLLFGTAGTQAVNFSLYKRLGEKALDDYDYVALLTHIPNVLVVRQSADAPANVEELARRAKSAPTGLTYGSPGTGSTVHLSGELFSRARALGLTHVPYKGSAPALADLLGGQIDLIFENITPALPFVQSGKLKALAVTTAARVPALPDVPTMQELGYDGFVTGTWNGLLAPRGTPQAVLARLEQAVLDIAAGTDFKARVTALGGEVAPMNGAQFRQFAQREFKRWAAIARQAGLQPQ